MNAIKEFLGRVDFPVIVFGAVVGIVLTILYNQVISFFRSKRRKYCLSKFLVSSSVYQQTDDGGLKIRVSYNNTDVDGPLSILSIRLRNDGLEDLVFSQRFSYLRLVFDGLEVLDVSVSSMIPGVNPIALLRSEGNYELGWDLLKTDECFFLKVVAKGEIKDISAVKFEVRAEGINQIKSPEYRVNEAMIPVLAAVSILAIPVALFWPNSSSFLGLMPMKVLLLIVFAFMILLFWVGALSRRIKWMKEQ